MRDREEIGTPTVIAVGGGKGGVGKSVVSILLAQWLARMGRSTVLVDLDLSGANIHTLLGIKSPPATLFDLLSRRVDSLEEVAFSTSLENLRVVCGASEILTLANPAFAQKAKIARKLYGLDAEFLVLDLGAGTSFDVLDFFLLAEKQIVVTTAEPISIHNAYAFLRNAVFRRLTQLSRQYPIVQDVVRRAVDPLNDLDIRTIRDLYTRIGEVAGGEFLDPIRREMSAIRPLVVVNQVREARERNTPRVLQQVAARYLWVQVEDFGGIAHDPEIQRIVSKMIPVTSGSGYRGAFEAVRDMAARLAGERARPSHRSPGEATLAADARR